MTTVSSSTVGRPSPRIIFVVALLVAVFAAAVIDIVIPITILDIADTFNILPGTVAQLDSFIAISSVATGLVLAGFGARFRYKTLVMMGVMFIAVCAIGLFLAPTFQLAQLIVTLNGVGSVLIVVTAQTYIGNSYSLDKKAKAIGWVAAAGAFANAVGAPVTGFMTGIGGWRSVFVWLILPTTFVSLVFMFLIFPSNPSEPQLSMNKSPFMGGFRQVFTNKSALACLVTAFLGNAFWFGGAVFEVTLLRTVFSASPGFAALIGPLAGTLFITAGAIIGGHAVNKAGRKRLTVAAIFSAGLFVLLSYFVPDLWVRQGLRWTASAFIGVMIAAASNLTLEQVPQFRSTMMSLSSVFGGVGAAVGFTVAGAVLNLYADPTVGFQMLGLTIAAFAFTGMLVNLFFARDPIRSPMPKIETS